MNILSRGQAYRSNDGFAAFEPGKTYYYLHNDEVLGCVLFVHFEVTRTRSQHQPVDVGPTLTRVTASLVQLDMSEFKSGTSNGRIHRKDGQTDFPPWMRGQRVLMSHQDDGVTRKTNRYLQKRDKYEREIEKRLRAIEPLNDAVKQIFCVRSAKEAQRHINSIIRQNDPKANETRVRTWFLIYQVFGMNPAVLQHDRTATGRSRFRDVDDTDTPGHVTKQPRRSKITENNDIAKRPYVRFSSKDKEKIVKGFKQWATIGSTFRKVYRESMKSNFGCVSKLVCSETRSYVMVHPKGKRFPSFTTWYSIVRKMLTRREVMTRLKGKNMYINEEKAWTGSFKQHVANVYERIESDAQRLRARPISNDGSVLPAMVVTTRVDVLSGRKTGIGFSLGGETSHSYRICRFSEAIGFRKYCRLIGLNTTLLTDLDSEGAVGTDYLVDRGAGASPNADFVDAKYKEVTGTKRLAPTASPQSKAIVESSHSREIQKHSEGHFVVETNLNVPELIKKCVIDLLAYNNSACKADSLSLDEIATTVVASPNELFGHYLSSGRSMGVPLPYDDAIRSFLDLHEARISLKGVTLSSHTYRTQNKADEIIFQGLTKNHSRPIKVYVLAFAPLYVYCESPEPNPRLIELKIVFDKMTSNKYEALNIFEADSLKSKRQKIKKAAAAHADGTALLATQELEAVIGRLATTTQNFSKQSSEKNKAAKQAAQQIKEVAYAKGN